MATRCSFQYWLVAAIAALVAATNGGCMTLSALGLPSLSGPHRLLASAESLSEELTAAAPLPRELAKDVLGQYIVEPGDVLVVEPADFDSPVRFTSSDQTVKPDGTIDLGKYGRMLAAGKTVDQVQVEVQAMVQRGSEEEPGQILVQLLGWESKVFYVLGEVNSPGAFRFNGRETVLDAIITGGGLTDRANRHKIILSRPSMPGDCRVVLPICYDQVVQLGDTSTNYQIMPGDRVYVASLTFWDDLIQTLLPGHFEECPRCGSEHVACFSSFAPGDGVRKSRRHSIRFGR